MIAIDFGLKRIGIAHNAGGIIIPIKPIIRKNRIQAAKELDAILVEKNAAILIIGVANEQIRTRIEHFVTLLTFKGRIEFIDEGLTSIEAENIIAGRKKSRKMRHNGTLDSICATIIMDRYIKSIS